MDERRAKRKRTNTYVVQVQSGRERRAKMLIERMLPDELVNEVFVPTYVKQVKQAGEWHEVESLLVPGYLYLVTTDIDEVFRCLHAVPALTKVLGTDARFVPLAMEEILWLKKLTQPGNRSIESSIGILSENKVRILKGPLKGHEAMIHRINRHKRIAEVEVRIMGRAVLVRVGLEIISASKTISQP